MLPFEEEIKEGYYVRTFDSKTPVDEFVWHRDQEDRWIEKQEPTTE